MSCMFPVLFKCLILSFFHSSGGELSDNNFLIIRNKYLEIHSPWRLKNALGERSGRYRLICVYVKQHVNLGLSLQCLVGVHVFHDGALALITRSCWFKVVIKCISNICTINDGEVLTKKSVRDWRSRRHLPPKLIRGRFNNISQGNIKVLFRIHSVFQFRD